MTGRRSRGQLVLLAAVVVVVALVPMALAYQQLGYHPTAGKDADATRVDRATRVVPVAVERAIADVDGTAWAHRERAVRRVKATTRPTLDRLTRPDVESGTTYEASYDQETARSIAANECPDGPNRQFGTCVASGGVVVQRRTNETAVVAVAVEFRATGGGERTRVVVVGRRP